MEKNKLLFLILFLAFLFRFYQLGHNPPSLYWDEASLGYNAFSILNSGVDEHGQKFPLTNFAAFGDYKPPIYIYLAVPPIFILGLTEFSIRFPSAFFGVMTVLLTYFLTFKLLKNRKAALLASFLLAISPWHVQLSRAAFEANVGLFFSVLGILSFILFVNGKKYFIYLSVISFAAAMYTFTGQRLFVPLASLVMGIIFFKELKNNLLITISALTFGIFLIFPLLVFSKTIEGRLRFEEVTIFKDLEPITEANHFIESDNGSPIFKLIHNRRLFYAREFLINYFDAFDPGFLFSHGDGNPRLSVRDIGELYYFEMPLIIFGAYFLIKNRSKYSLFIFSWLVISPLGPATARETPHALRMEHILPTYQIISGYGLLMATKQAGYSKYFKLLSSLTLFLFIFYYLHQYYFHYPKNFSGEWQYGYKQVVEETNLMYPDVDKIVVTEKLGRPYIYFLLYNKVNPLVYSQSADVVKDNFFFYHVNSFGKYIFTDEVSQFHNQQNILFVTPHNKLPEGTNKIKTVYDLGNFAVFDIGIR